MHTAVEGVWAAGDCTSVLHLVTGKRAYIPLGTTANKQGRVAGENIAGGHAIFRGVVGTAVAKVFRLEVARTGLTEREAQQEGVAYVAVTITATDKARYYPTASPLTVKLLAEKSTGRLLGGQIVGQSGATKRIDVIATALHARMTVDQFAQLDLGYAPPFAPVWDPLLIAAQQLGKQV
jgi:NADPH-dependent 2,4-dienoyl-CoA reductase/sulfur reductase-like enzyme